MSVNRRVHKSPRTSIDRGKLGGREGRGGRSGGGRVRGWDWNAIRGGGEKRAASTSVRWRGRNGSMGGSIDRGKPGGSEGGGVGGRVGGVGRRKFE